MWPPQKKQPTKGPVVCQFPTSKELEVLEAKVLEEQQHQKLKQQRRGPNKRFQQTGLHPHGRLKRNETKHQVGLVG